MNEILTGPELQWIVENTDQSVNGLITLLSDRNPDQLPMTSMKSPHGGNEMNRPLTVITPAFQLSNRANDFQTQRRTSRRT